MRRLSRIIDHFAFPYSLYLVIKSPGISGETKLKAGLILTAIFVYLLNPIAIFANFIPVLGWLDDLIILSICMAVAKKVVPEVNMPELRQKARARTKRVVIWILAISGALILIGLSLLGWLIYLIVRHFQ